MSETDREREREGGRERKGVFALYSEFVCIYVCRGRERGRGRSSVKEREREKECQKESLCF